MKLFGVFCLLLDLIQFVVTAFYSLIILQKYMSKAIGERPQAYLTPLSACIGSDILPTSSLILLLFFYISCCRLAATLLRFCLLSVFSVAFSYLLRRSFFSYAKNKINVVCCSVKLASLQLLPFRNPRCSSMLLLEHLYNLFLSIFYIGWMVNLAKNFPSIFNIQFLGLS
jgi:hypothetical protein